MSVERITELLETMATDIATSKVYLQEIRDRIQQGGSASPSESPSSSPSSSPSESPSA